MDGRTAFGVLLLLENHHDKDKELFRVVLAIHDTINEGGKGGEESFGQMFRKFVVVGMAGDEVFVVCLPGFVICHATVQVVTIVVVDVVTTDFIKFQVNGGLFVAVVAISIGRD